MKYSYSWLKQLSGTKKSPKDLTKMIGLKGFELEETEDLGKRFDGFVVGEILEIEKHPDADRLKVVKVGVGSQIENRKSKIENLQIVCGADNIEVGQKVPVALIGAAMPVGNFVIEKTKIRGVVSRGMLCAEDELGLGKDHEGILILGSEAKTGQSLAEALGIDDYVLEFDILPDRAHDCLSYEGMAREVSAMEGRQLKVKSEKLKVEVQSSKSETLEIDIKDKKLCPRYIGAVLEDVNIGKSPKWMQSALVASGMEPINNIVDITNYVMLEIGSPLHAFDYNQVKRKREKAKGASIMIRKAKEGEELELLDDTKLKLDKNDLVIANDEKALALAGIKGGKDSGISTETTKIVLEAANFNSFNVRKSRQRHALSTEAQMRFEKNISPVLAQRAAARAIELFEKYAGAKLVEAVDADFSENKIQAETLKLGSITKLLGHEVDPKETVEILQNLGFSLSDKSESAESRGLNADKRGKEKSWQMKVEVPYWRLDIEGPEDLVEEVGRIHGYEKIEEQPIVAPISIPRKNISRQLEWRFRQLFVSLGMSEVRNYSFYSSRDVDICGIKDKHFELANPLTDDQDLMRTTLLPGIMKNVAHNAKYFDSVMLFELGRVFKMKRGNKPQEKLMLSSAVLLRSQKGEQQFYVLKGRLEAFLSRVLGIEVFFREPKERVDDIFHQTRSAEVVIEKDKGKGNVVGRVGQADEGVAKNYDIDGKVMLVELDFDLIAKHVKEEVVFESLKKYPDVLRDISMYAPNRIEAHAVKKVIQESAGQDLLKIDLFDVFVDKAKDKKSLAYHLTFGSDERTLKRKEVDDLIEEIEIGLEKVGVKMRRQ